MRIIARFKKGEAVRFVSHLDVQRLFQRAFRRAGIPLAYSQGFNPHPLLSFATALSVGYTSCAEWLEIKLESPMTPATFQTQVNAALPQGFSLLEVMEAEDKLPTLSAIMTAASYTIETEAAQDLQPALDALVRAPILVEKRTKAGMKTVDLLPMLYGASLQGKTLRLAGCLDAKGSLGVDLFMGALMRESGPFFYTVHRDQIYSADGLVMPQFVQTAWGGMSHE